MQRISLVNVAHNLIREVLRPGDIAIDATVGNGHDTVFLVKQVSPSGKVFGFDSQQAALDSTWLNVESCFRAAEKACSHAPLRPECLSLIHASHADMAEKIPVQYHGYISAIMFNLGYLPGGDKGIITRTDSTLLALNSASLLIRTEGLINILAYPGHVDGDQETEQVKNWCEQLNHNLFNVSTIYSKEHKESAPRLFAVSRIM
jgi:hypothetical protein